VAVDVGRREPGGGCVDTTNEVIRSALARHAMHHRCIVIKGMGHRWAIAALCVLALPGCPTVDLGDTPSDIGACNPSGGVDYFISDIEPKYLKIPDPTNGCALCATTALTASP
jgi:hypothetical protein